MTFKLPLGKSWVDWGARWPSGETGHCGRGHLHLQVVCQGQESQMVSQKSG